MTCVTKAPYSWKTVVEDLDEKMGETEATIGEECGDPLMIMESAVTIKRGVEYHSGTVTTTAYDKEFTMALMTWNDLGKVEVAIGNIGGCTTRYVLSVTAREKETDARSTDFVFNVLDYSYAGHSITSYEIPDDIPVYTNDMFEVDIEVSYGTDVVASDYYVEAKLHPVGMEDYVKIDTEEIPETSAA